MNANMMIPLCVTNFNDASMSNILAYILLAVLVLLFLILLVLTCCCFKSFEDLGFAWKSFIFNLVKHQLVALLLFIHTGLPCCLKSFLRILYAYLIGWDSALGKTHSLTENEVLNVETVNTLSMEGILPLFFYNFSILFLVNLFVLALLIFFLIWKLIFRNKVLFMYKLHHFFVFNILVAFLFLSVPQMSFFSAINFLYPVFSTSYTLFNFVLAIVCMTIFIFWIFFFLSKMNKKDDFFNRPTNVNSYFFFLAGYLEKKKSRFFDLLFIMIVAFSAFIIGILIKRQIISIALVLAAVIFYFIVILAIKPFVYSFVTFIEIFSNLFFVLALIMILYIGIAGEGFCVNCLNIHNLFCILLVIFLFIYLILNSLGLIIQSIRQTCFSESYRAINLNRQSGMVFTENQDGRIMALAGDGNNNNNNNYYNKEEYIRFNKNGGLNERADGNNNNINKVYENTHVVNTIIDTNQNLANNNNRAKNVSADQQSSSRIYAKADGYNSTDNAMRSQMENKSNFAKAEAYGLADNAMRSQQSNRNESSMNQFLNKLRKERGLEEKSFHNHSNSSNNMSHLEQSPLTKKLQRDNDDSDNRSPTRQKIISTNMLPPNNIIRNDTTVVTHTSNNVSGIPLTSMAPRTSYTDRKYMN